MTDEYEDFASGEYNPFDEVGDAVESVQLEETTREGYGEGYALILFDDAYHYREDVVRQLMKALGCNVALANGIVARVEANGKGVVTINSKEQVDQIDRILQEILLHTLIRRIGS